MKIETIKKSIGINAPKEKVWDVLINDKFTRIWYALFSEGTFAETDWKVGSKVIFADNSHSGLISKVIANDPYELLSLEHQGSVKDGIEDYESQEAQDMKGAREIYRLSEKEGVTHLSVECDMAEPYFNSMSLAWDKAAQKIKELAETA